MMAHGGDRELSAPRVRTAGKFFQLGTDKFFVKGFSYGPFAPNRAGDPFPDRGRLRSDFAHMAQLGANTIRVYFPPPMWLLDEALSADLRVLIDVPWEKHRCVFEDWEAAQRARQRVATTARHIGVHPAVMAISVVNEIPVDVVRFQGRRRVERFVQDLLSIVKQEAPECLATFVNFPTTEFLEPAGCDFCCFNVYLHDQQQLGVYLDRLQHIAGNLPLLLGEYGIDSQREGENAQANLLSRHVTRIFQHGLAGSIVFSYTDDWFTGGHQVEDWFFGVTRRDRSEKPAAQALRGIWPRLPWGESGCDRHLPKVSVVVCSYNGARTLRECLESLVQLDYPDYEVILVDDGSQDATPTIAAAYPQIVYYRQANCGLSAARNLGARLATGDIVAYTDDDCVADTHWLRYLVQAMHEQGVEAIGGPNITPLDDNWTAKCVAASPGNPSHVMLDDHRAEHIPGCNMAYRRQTLLEMGGFDPQFRQAGDDVDLCWRFLDAGLPIGYAPGAMVWHHRRSSVRDYARQQKGYGRSEAMVHFKHPQRSGAFGRSTWQGIIYGDGAVGLMLMPDRIYHGQFGGGLFQTIYRHNRIGMWSIVRSIEWHATAAYLLLLSALWPPLVGVSIAMWSATAGGVAQAALRAPLPLNAPRWCRYLVAYLYFAQPIWRGWHRVTHLLASKQLPPVPSSEDSRLISGRWVSPRQYDSYWESGEALGRQELLQGLVRECQRLGWAGDFNNAWSDWDLKLVADCWHDVTIYTATEELGWPHRFTRVRTQLRPTVFSWVVYAAGLMWSLTAGLTGSKVALAAGFAGLTMTGIGVVRSRRRCLQSVGNLVSHVARCVPLEAFSVTSGMRQVTHPPARPAEHHVDAGGEAGRRRVAQGV